MFIPLGVESRGDSYRPWSTLSLLLINVLMFAAQVVVGPRLTYGYSMVPAEITQGEDILDSESISIRGRTATIPHAPGPTPIYLTLLTSLFLHAGLFHLIGNLLFLGVFGGNMERLMGHGRFLVFYLCCGLGAAALHIAVAPQSIIPCLGASGAISGVLGAYLLLLPDKKVRAWFWLAGTVELPAYILVGLWAVLQGLLAYLSLHTVGKEGGVGYATHVGGLFSGFLMAYILLVWSFRKTEPSQPAQKQPVSDRQLMATNAVLTATTGQELTAVVALFTETDPRKNNPNNYTALIDWGDGSAPSWGRILAGTNGDFEVSGSHTYHTTGFFLVPVTLSRLAKSRRQQAVEVCVNSCVQVTTETAR